MSDYKNLSIIKEFNDAYRKREKTKDYYDEIIDLSVSAESENELIKLNAINDAIGKNVRLLDEGTVISLDSYPLFVIKKGAIQEYYDNLSSDFVGAITIGHQDVVSMPIYLGTWTKDDLTVVDLDNGRKALDVKLNLDSESLYVKELQRIGLPIAISGEFMKSIDWESTEEWGIMVYDKIDLMAFSVVGHPGNVKSGNINLKGDNKMSLPKEFGSLKEFLSGKKKEEEKKDETITLSAKDFKELKETLELAVTVKKDYDQLVELATKLKEDNDEKAKEIESLKAHQGSIKEKEAQVDKGLDEIQKLVSDFKDGEKLRATKNNPIDELTKNIPIEASKNGFGG